MEMHGFSSSKIPVDWYRSANHGLRTRALIHGKQQQLQTVAKRFHFSHFALFFLVLRSWRKASILNFLFLKSFNQISLVKLGVF